MNQLRRITGAAAFFALGVLWSNIWGQLRDSLRVAWFGNNAVAAYDFALQVPFIAPQVITSALMAAMAPVLVALRKEGRADEARRVADGMVLAMALVLIPVALAGELLAEPILRLLYYWKVSGGHEAAGDTLVQAVELSRLLFPYLLISGIAGAMGAALQSFERFKPLAVGQFIPNVVIVACMVGLHQRLGITSQAVGVLLGGVAYFLLLLSFYVRLGRNGSVLADGERLIPWWRLPAVRAIGVTILPLLLIGIGDWGTGQLAVLRAVSAVQIGDPAAQKIFSSAYRILQVPQGVFVSALSIVLLPFLSGFAATDDRPGLASAVNAGIRMVLYAVAPTTILLSTLAAPMINVLYRHGAFSAALAHEAAPLAALMAPSVLLASAADVLVLTLMAMRRVWPLLAVQAVSLATMIRLSSHLAAREGLHGIGVAVLIVGVLNLALLFVTVERTIRLKDWQEMARFLLKLIVGCAGVWLPVHLLQAWFAGRGDEDTIKGNLTEIVAAAVLGIVLYGILSELLRIPEWQMLRDLAARKARGLMGLTDERTTDPGTPENEGEGD